MPKSNTHSSRVHMPAIQQAGETIFSKSVPVVFPGRFQIASSLIMYCKAEGRYTRFYIDGRPRSIMVCKNIGQYEALLPSQSFCRIHHNCIVNIHFIADYVNGRTGHVILQNGEMLNVSSRRKKSLLHFLNRK